MRYISNMKVLNKIKIEIRICINNRLINKKTLGIWEIHFQSLKLQTKILANSY